MPLADCRRCVFFKPIDQLEPRLRRAAEAWVARRRPWARPLGWCGHYGRPVTYYTGTCPAYRPRRAPARSLEEFMGGARP